MKNLSLLLAALLVLAACEKVEAPLQLEYPSLYRGVRFENTTSVRLFTQSGEITDGGLINRFSERFGENFLYPNSLSTQPAQADSIRLLTATDAQIKEGNSFKNHILIINGRDLSFVPLDTARAQGGSEYEFNLHNAIGVRKPAYQKRNQVPGPGGFITVYDLVVEKFATATPEQLDFLVINYVLSRGGGLNRSVRKVSFNNQFDMDAHKLLQTGDTLAVQEFKLSCQKD